MLKNTLGVSKVINILKDNIVKKIFKNSGIVLFGNSIASALNLISFTLMANKLGPTLLGILVLAQTYATIINDIFNVRTWESMVKFGSENDNESLANVIKVNSLLDISSAAIACIFAVSLVKPVVKILGWDINYTYIITIYSISILFNLTSFTVGIPRLFDEFLSVAKIQVVVAVIRLFSILYITFFPKPLIWYVCIYMSLDIAVNISLIFFSVYLLGKKLGKGWWRGKLHIDRKQLHFIWWTNLRTIISIPVRNLDNIIISSVISVKMVGIYKVYKEITGLIGRIGDPINQVIYPEYTKLISKNETKQVYNVTIKTISLMIILGIFIIVILVLMSKFIVGRFFGLEYLEELNALYMLICLYGISFFLIPINSLFIAAGYAKSSFYLVLFTNTLYLITTLYLGKLIGIYGIITAYALQMVLNQGIKAIILNNNLRQKKV